MMDQHLHHRCTIMRYTTGFAENPDGHKVPQFIPMLDVPCLLQDEPPGGPRGAELNTPEHVNTIIAGYLLLVSVDTPIYERDRVTDITDSRGQPVGPLSRNGKVTTFDVENVRVRRFPNGGGFQSVLMKRVGD